MSVELKWDWSKEILFIKKGKVLHQVKVNEIIYLNSEGNYVTLVTAHGKYVVKISLRRIREFFPANGFVQTHRSYLVQIKYIEKVDLSTNEVYLANQVLPLGRKFRTPFLKQLNLIQ